MIFGISENLNTKRLFPTVLGVFATVWITDFIIHGLILSPTYAATQNLWRTPEEMKSYMLWMLLGQAIWAKFFTIIFAKGYEGRGISEGIRFGALIGPFSVAPFFIQYSVTPLPQILLWAWCGFAIAQALLCGIVASLIYKKS